MHRKPLVRDRRPVDQSARDHPPADRTLQPAEREQCDKPPAIAARDPAQRGERGQGQREDDADRHAEQPVEPLPEENALERRQAHAFIDELILRARLIQREHRVPFGAAQRRDHATDRVPLDDRQARLGQPGDAADDDHREHQCGDREQPRGDGFRVCSRDRGRRGEGRGNGSHLHPMPPPPRAAKSSPRRGWQAAAAPPPASCGTAAEGRYRR